MGIRPYLTALRRQWLVLVVGVVVGLLVAGLGYLVVPSRYSSTVTFYVATTSSNSGSVDGGQFVQTRVASYAQILQSERVAQLVSRGSGVPLDSVRGALSASYSSGTVLLTATATAATPGLAFQMAQTLPQVFPPLVEGLDNQNQAGVGVDVQVVSGPVTSSAPTFPVWWQFAVAGLVAGLVLGLVVVLVRQARRQTMNGGPETEAMTRMPVLGLISEDPALGQGEWRPGTGSQRAEAFQQLRAAVVGRQRHQGCLVVAVLSALSGEGRTSVAAGLADAVAGTGAKALLLDADLRRPGVAGLCGVEARPGLSDVVRGSIQADKAISRPDGSRLDVLPAGAGDGRPADLLAGARFSSTLQELRKRYDVIVVDTAPVAGLADATVVATQADACLVLVRDNFSRRSGVSGAIRTAETAGANLIGTVLNRYRPTRAERAEFRRAVGAAS